MNVLAKDQMAACIKAELEARGMTQAAFARLLGRSEKHVSQVMTGRAGSAEIDYWAFVLDMKFEVRMVPLSGSAESNEKGR